MTAAKNQFRKCQYDTKLLCSWINACDSCAVPKTVGVEEDEMAQEILDNVIIEDPVVFDPEHNIYRCIVCGSEIKKED